MKIPHELSNCACYEKMKSDRYKFKKWWKTNSVWEIKFRKIVPLKTLMFCVT